MLSRYKNDPVEIVVVNNLRIWSHLQDHQILSMSMFAKGLSQYFWNVDVMISHQCNDSLAPPLADTKLKWKWTKIFKVRKILIKSYVNLNRVKYVPIIHLPKAVLTIKSKLLMNLNLRNSDLLCKTRKSEIKCQSLLWLWWQCNAMQGTIIAIDPAHRLVQNPRETLKWYRTSISN